ncbi:hypothetical protein L9F63_001272, partial [Diploptera punctata]
RRAVACTVIFRSTIIIMAFPDRNLLTLIPYLTLMLIPCSEKRSPANGQIESKNPFRPTIFEKRILLLDSVKISITGQPRKYLRRQINKCKKGKRKFKPRRIKKCDSFATPENLSPVHPELSSSKDPSSLTWKEKSL